MAPLLTPANENTIHWDAVEEGEVLTHAAPVTNYRLSLAPSLFMRANIERIGAKVSAEDFDDLLAIEEAKKTGTLRPFAEFLNKHDL